MPKVILTEQARQLDRLYNFIKGMSAVKGVSQTRMALYLGYSQQNYSQKLRRRSLSLADFVEIMSVLDVDITEILRKEISERK